MVYATEETPLGTAGSVRNARDELDERFLVISGDVLTDIDLSAIVDRHVERGALATIGLTAVENPLEFGIVVTDEDGAVERFLEKPSWGQVFSDTVNNGIFVLEPQIFDHIPAGRPVDFSGEVFPGLLEAGLRIDGFVTSGYWEDVGTLEAYASAHRDVLDGKVDVDVPGFRLEEGVWLGEGAEVHPDAAVVGPAVIGAYSRVEPGPASGRTRSSGRTSWSARTPTSSGSSSTTTATSAPACGCGARSSGARATCGRACGARRAWCSATSASSAPRRS
jgi:mannose-1-phosphate guanylyltransferase/phosphomannomutase